MSKKILSGLLVVLLCCQTSIVFASGWKTLRLNDRFLAEGASAGDLNSDGHLDVVCGPVWYQGPDFQKSHELAPAKEFPVSSYSDQFFSEVVDVNADGHPDVIVIGFPGAAARLYLNPGKPAQSGHWEMKEIANIVDNESPAIIDLIPGGLPEIVCGRESQYGYYAATSDPTAPWTWHPISKPGTCGGRFAHGMGVGDVNSDGKLDILDKTYWWEQPANVAEGNQWTQRQWALEAYGGGGAQIQVSDFDGDGDADIVTSLNAHGYGLAWFEQISIDRFERHDIMGMSSIENDYGVAFSQLHALKLEDMDGDGLKDLVTGKRWYAHNGKDIGGLQEPVLYWFQCQRTEEGVEFVPHLVDRNSGVGVDVLVKDLNKDGRPDIVSCSKHGLDVHLQDAAADALRPQRWRVAEGRDQSTYLNDSTPQEAAAQMLVPDGFHVDLIAGEPELTQPIAMCFDARGRIWVVEGHTYPIPAPPGQGRDRILIFADEDANGTFESRKVFQEGLNLVSGIEIGFGGVWVGAAPYFMFIPDANQDDIPDAEPQILLDGWGHQDTHETLNSFTWGPDGWLYGCHGVFTHSRVGKPGTPDADRIPLNAAVWRYHPTNHRFEVYAHGTSNPWGVDYDDQGNWFNTACVIPHLYHIQQGARYQRQAGQHFNPYTYDDIKTIADHAHYAGNIRDHAFWGDNYTARRPSPNDTSMVGGGHAHCGLAIYNADVFPPEYRGDLFFHNLHGHRVVRETLIRDGSGFVGMHRPDFSLSRDHKQIGVGIMVGPDGALYTSDWHDLQTCHHRTPEIWDRTDGRLYRIRYGEVRPQNLNLWKESDQQLVERLSDGNGLIVRQAQRILQERAAAGTLNSSLVEAWMNNQLKSGTSQRNRLRAIWAGWVTGVLTPEKLPQLLSDADEYVRTWGVHLAGEAIRDGKADRVAGALEQIVQLAATEPADVVRRNMACLAPALSEEQSWQCLAGLTTHHVDANDRNIPWLVWYALEPLVDRNPDRAYDISQKSHWPNLLRFTIRKVGGSPQGRSVLANRLSQENQKGDWHLVLEELNGIAASRAGLEMPENWPSAMSAIQKQADPNTLELARRFAVQIGDQTVFPHFRDVIRDQNLPPQKRLEALAALQTARDAELPNVLYPLLSDQIIAERAVAALSQYPNDQTAAVLLQNYGSFNEKARTAALGTLVSRKSWAGEFVKALETGKIDPSSVPAFIVRQLVDLKDQKLTARIEKSWGRIAPSDEEKKELYQKYLALLKPNAIERADASDGRALYEANCGKCHKLFGEGGAIGPDITGANRSNVSYWLENILEPNALIGRAYQVTTFATADGRIVSGIVVDENQDAVTVQTATDKVVISKQDIEERQLAEVSLMPDGQLQRMTDQQILNLIKYLMGPAQVALPPKQ